jgi:hypothetical protein
LLLYGTGVITAGAHSILLVSMMGLCFMGLGTVTVIERSWGDRLMAFGLGLCHIAFGLVIARRYGG